MKIRHPKLTSDLHMLTLGACASTHVHTHIHAHTHTHSFNILHDRGNVYLGPEEEPEPTGHCPSLRLHHAPGRPESTASKNKAFPCLLWPSMKVGLSLHACVPLSLPRAGPRVCTGAPQARSGRVCESETAPSGWPMDVPHSLWASPCPLPVHVHSASTFQGVTWKTAQS